jgi:hypothetical protein
MYETFEENYHIICYKTVYTFHIKWSYSMKISLWHHGTMDNHTVAGLITYTLTVHTFKLGQIPKDEKENNTVQPIIKMS